MGRARSKKDKTYYKDEPYGVALGDLPLAVTTMHLWQSEGNYHDKIVKMDPIDFLKLTTRVEEDAADIIAEGWDVDDYNEFAIYGANILMPMLWIKVDKNGDGEVRSHEGRHRAGALIRCCPGEKMYVGLRIDGTKVYKGESTIDDLPVFLIGEFWDVDSPASRGWARSLTFDWEPVTKSRKDFFKKLGDMAHGEPAGKSKKRRR